jgi:antitoxin ParD1/3/4
MPIQLTADQEAIIQRKIQAGQYQSPEAVIEAALQLLNDYESNEAEWIESIRPKIDAAYENTDPAIDGSTFINQLRQRLQSQHQ